MAKFRNRLVHLYGEIDNQYVYDFINEDLQDIKEFRFIIKNRYIGVGFNCWHGRGQSVSPKT